jgi:uncharacterized Zn finger protein (UPF0148 family)
MKCPDCGTELYEKDGQFFCPVLDKMISVFDMPKQSYSLEEVMKCN